MNRFDLGPWNRSTVGFERVLDALDRQLSLGNTYPPYNIIRNGENSYAIELAVAGFRENELEIVVKENELTITGTPERETNTESFLHRGISSRSFTRAFTLGEHVYVKNAVVENGLLVISLEREIPEESKPRKIPVTFNK